VNAAHPGRTTAGLGLAALLCTAAMNLHHLAWWCLPLLVLASALHLHASLRGHAQPGRWARAGLALLLTAGVLASFRTLNGLAAGATLLAAMTAAKLFEARTVRDWFVISGATLFLLLAACLDRQQLWRLPLYALNLWLVLATLRGLAGGENLAAAPLLRGAARQLLYAVPLAVVLFLFFPRLPGAFWALPGDEAGVTGLSDEMSPGRIARLVESDEPALRARFAGAPPPLIERYWRGPVLHDFDGYTWRRHRGGAGALPMDPAAHSALQFSGPSYHYSMTLQPNLHGTIVALEMTRPPELPNTYYSDDFQLVSRRPLSQAQAFELNAYPHAASREPLSGPQRRMDLQLPANRNPRARALALRLRAAASGDADYAARVLGYFRDGGFEYTLTPQRLGADAVDELLFDTHQGFCGHFASAFVDLMRAAGVPARVVTGYQGGEWNSIGSYLTVRQSDAHAWAEIWLDGRGWVRADPTAMVAPERLSRPLLDFGAGFGSAAARTVRAAPWLNGMAQAWDALNAWWQDDVVGFNFATQLNIAGWLGFGDRDWQTLAIALGAGMGLWLLWIAWSLRRLARAARPDRLTRAWTRIDRRLARAGLERAAHEGVLAYCERIARSHPSIAAALRPLARSYVALRFGPPGEAAQLAAFLRAARAYRIARAAHPADAAD